MLRLIMIVLLGSSPYLLLIASIMYDSGHDRSMWWHRKHGHFRVLYSDGKRSQPMTFWVARDYAKMLDGKVVRK